MTKIVSAQSLTKWLVVGLLLMSPLGVLAQEMPEWAAPGTSERRPVPTEHVGSNNPPDFPDTPLDPAGLALLAAAGGALAARRLRRTE